MKKTAAPANLHAVAAHGSALIVIYWIIALLSLLVLGGAQLLLSELAMQSVEGQRARAEQWAEMGLAIAAHPQIEPSDPALRRQVSAMESFSATIEWESARLNLNALLQNRDVVVLRRLFELWGLRPEEASSVVAALVDWVDADDVVTHGGAEEEEYRRAGMEGVPPNRRLWALKEAAGVSGMGALEAVRPDWQEDFTLFGGGKLALEDAGPEAVYAACGCSLAVAEEFVKLRRGRDGRENTEDDVALPSVEEVLDLLGVPAVDRPAVMARVTRQGNTLRLRSEGQMEEIRVERWLVVEGRGPGMRVLAAGSRRWPREKPGRNR